MRQNVMLSTALDVDCHRPMLSTRQKMAIARVLNVAIIGARTVAGRTPRVTVRRRQVTWDLDLNEGIDLAIYLGLYQRSPTRRPLDQAGRAGARHRRQYRGAQPPARARS